MKSRMLVSFTLTKFLSNLGPFLMKISVFLCHGPRFDKNFVSVKLTSILDFINITRWFRIFHPTESLSPLCNCLALVHKLSISYFHDSLSLFAYWCQYLWYFSFISITCRINTSKV